MILLGIGSNLNSSYGDRFKKQSINDGSPICVKQTWNTECHTKMMTIDRLSDIIDKVFG